MAYEQEKSKSIIMKRCNRIYHEYLKNSDQELYNHLIEQEVTPELQLVRWLRCLLSREFVIEFSLSIWDFIFCGIESKHRQDLRISREQFQQSGDDPLSYLDFLCVGMIINIKGELMESDFSMCLALLLRYPEPESVEPLIS